VDCLSTFWSRWPEALEIVQADTVLRWRRQGFRHYLLGKNRRRRPGRPAIESEIQSLIRRMSRQNWLWGGPRIHGELLKPGIDVWQTMVAKYMDRRVGPPSQHWNTFLRNRARELVPVEIFQRPIRRFRSLITWISGAVKRQLTGLFRNLPSLPATSARQIVDEPVSCQSIHRLRHHTVIAAVGFAGRGPPIVEPLFNNLLSVV
jgi:hypothetical protein